MSFVPEPHARRAPTAQEREEFYRSRKWDKIRENARRRDFYMCRICETNRAVDGHHLTYERWGGEEEPRDILSLCRDCHGKVHEKIEDPSGKAKDRESVESSFNEHLSDLDLTGGHCGCDRCFYFWREHKDLNLGTFRV